MDIELRWAQVDGPAKPGDYSEPRGAGGWPVLFRLQYRKEQGPYGSCWWGPWKDVAQEGDIAKAQG
jgi:hypothetical protein